MRVTFPMSGTRGKRSLGKKRSMELQGKGRRRKGRGKRGVLRVQVQSVRVRGAEYDRFLLCWW